MLAWLEEVKGQIATTLGAMLERTVRLAFEPPVKLRSSDFDKILPDGPIAIRLSFGGGRDIHLLLSRATAAAMADLAALGDGTAAFNEETHLSTLQEVWGQVAADLEPEVTTLTGAEVEITPAEVSTSCDEPIAACGSNPAVNWSISIENWGEGKFVLLFEPAFISLFQSDEEPAPAPKKAASAKAPPPEPSRSGSAPRQAAPTARPAAFEDFGPQPAKQFDAAPKNIDSLLDISLPITIELGRTKMLIRDVLDLGPGSVIELDKMSGEPVDLFVNDKKFARGEVVVIEENFGVRITELLKVDERIKALR
jgi:flagellar motor switch protein FliN/FliY